MANSKRAMHSIWMSAPGPGIRPTAGTALQAHQTIPTISIPTLTEAFRKWFNLGRCCHAVSFISISVSICTYSIYGECDGHDIPEAASITSCILTHATMSTWPKDEGPASSVQTSTPSQTTYHSLTTSSTRQDGRTLGQGLTFGGAFHTKPHVRRKTTTSQLAATTFLRILKLSQPSEPSQSHHQAPSPSTKPSPYKSSLPSNQFGCSNTRSYHHTHITGQTTKTTNNGEKPSVKTLRKNSTPTHHHHITKTSIQDTTTFPTQTRGFEKARFGDDAKHVKHNRIHGFTNIAWESSTCKAPQPLCALATRGKQGMNQHNTEVHFRECENQQAVRYRTISAAVHMMRR